MREKNSSLETNLIACTVILLFALTMLAFDKVLPKSFQEITGEVVTMVNVTAPPPVNCNFTLYSGLNLVSFFCIPTSYPRDFVIINISNLEAIFEYQKGASDLWKSYNPSLPSFVVQDLNFMSRTEGYWIDMSADEDFFLEGGLRLPTSITLMPGWNLPGYPTNEVKAVNDSFSSLEGNYTEARAYNPITDVFISYVPGVGGAINQTEPYYGYWINTTIDEVWTVD